MAFIEIDIDGAEVLDRHLEKLQKFPEVAERVIEKHLNKIVVDAKSTVPVRTGALRASIRSIGVRIQGDIISGEIEASVNYASLIEERTGFLTDALEGQLDDLIQDLQQAFENLLR